MDRTFNSIGSNIFLEFGKQKEIILQNGKKHLQKEWCIWLSWTSWRITQNDRYIVGSAESLEVNIQTHLEKLLGKRFQSFQFISQFLDLELSFEDEYKITTFFNRATENQWLIFLPDDSEIAIDCSSEKAIESIQKLASQVKTKNKYQELGLSFSNVEVKEIRFEKNELSKIICTNGFSFDLGLSAWRLQKNDRYQIGHKDYYFDALEGKSKEIEDRLLDLIGEKIKHISIDSSRMDLRLEFADGYIFEIFTNSKVEPWKIYIKNDVILTAKIENKLL